MDLNKKNYSCLVCSIPVYKCKIGINITVSDILKKFKGEYLFTDENAYAIDCREKITDINIIFAIVEVKGFKNRVYFEIIDNTTNYIDIDRLK